MVIIVDCSYNYPSTLNRKKNGGAVVRRRHLQSVFFRTLVLPSYPTSPPPKSLHQSDLVNEVRQVVDDIESSVSATGISPDIT